MKIEDFVAGKFVYCEVRMSSFCRACEEGQGVLGKFAQVRIGLGETPL